SRYVAGDLPRQEPGICSPWSLKSRLKCRRDGPAMADHVEDAVCARGRCKVLERVPANDVAKLIDPMIQGAGLQQLGNGVTRQGSHNVFGARVPGGEQQKHQWNAHQGIELHEAVEAQIACVALLAHLPVQYACESEPYERPE